VSVSVAAFWPGPGPEPDLECSGAILLCLKLDMGSNVGISYSGIEQCESHAATNDNVASSLDVRSILYPLRID